MDPARLVIRAECKQTTLGIELTGLIRWELNPTAYPKKQRPHTPEMETAARCGNLCGVSCNFFHSPTRLQEQEPGGVRSTRFE